VTVFSRACPCRISITGNARCLHFSAQEFVHVGLVFPAAAAKPVEDVGNHFSGAPGAVAAVTFLHAVREAE